MPSPQQLILTYQSTSYIISLETPSLSLLKTLAQKKLGIPPTHQSLYVQSKILKNSKQILSLPRDSRIELLLTIPGGKGGFGSLMRGQAIIKRKITNFDASRDLQGRRIRNVTARKKLEEWVKKKKEEDKRVEAEVKEFKQHQKINSGGEKTIKLKQEFKDKVEKWDQEMSGSVRQGLKKAKKDEKKRGNNGPLEDEPVLKKKVHTETFDDMDFDVKPVDKITNKLKSILADQKDISEENDEKKVEVIEEKAPVTVKEEVKEKIVYEDLDLTRFKTMDQLAKLGPDHIKNELARLGLKCGGSPQDRVKRLWEIKLDPNLMFDPKYIAKK